MTSKPKHIPIWFEWLIHSLGWLCLFASPLLFNRHGESVNWPRYVHGLFIPGVMMVVFYLNYLVLVPRFFMQRRYNLYFAVNLVVFAVLCLCIHLYMHTWFPIPRHHADTMPHHQLHAVSSPFWHGLSPRVLFLLRDVMTLITATASALAIRLSIEWKNTQLANEHLQYERTDAALQNLKSQTSPHFLLNTLNNIYSLIAFDTDKAQQAVMDLAKMLRYQLYESDAELVPLSKEAAFLDNYITLMRMRLGENVRVDYQLDISTCANAMIAPHILICLVENAFKHGICAKNPSFIDIRLHADHDAIHFVCTNSNYPKRNDDKTPGGIGLQQVAQRLQLLYPHCHSWHHGPSADGSIYTSEITLNLNT